GTRQRNTKKPAPGLSVRRAFNRIQPVLHSPHPGTENDPMKTPVLRRWDNLFRNDRRTGPVWRARRRRQALGLEALENRVTLSLVPQMVVDINPGAGSSSPSQMVAIGSMSYFAANDGVHCVELWKSDGTAAGSTLVKDIYPGTHREYDYY